MDKQQTVPSTREKAVDNGGTKSYLVMVVLAFFAGVTGLARAYRGEKIGWVRFWMYVGATVLVVIPFVNILAALVMLVVSVWGIVDFFLVYRLRDDAEGKPLHATARDQKWAGVFNIIYIIGLSLGAIMIILSIIFAGFIMTNIMNRTGIDYKNQTGSSIVESIESAADESKSTAKSSEVLANYAKLQDGMSRATAESTLGVNSENCSEYSFGDTKSVSCTYGSYEDGYMISLGFTNDQLNTKSKYQY